MRPVLFAMPGNEALTTALAAAADADAGVLEHRQFPDSETYLRFATPVEGRSVALVSSLNQPDGKVLPLLLAAAALRDLGAERVGLIAPYLAYMRQDKRFKEGEAVTSVAFARLLSAAFNWAITVDPHLHRYHAMRELYSIAFAVVHAAPLLATYLREQQRPAFLVGPDEESEQWIAAVAALAGVPHVTMRKERRGDRDVAITFSGIDSFQGLTPVLVDDMISSGRTMEVASRQLIERGFAAPVCLAVHGLLAGDARSRLEAAGAKVVTTNTIPGATALLDVTPLLAGQVKACLAGEA